MTQMRIVAAAIFLLAQAATPPDASKVLFLSASKLRSEIEKAKDRGLGLSYARIIETPEYTAEIVRRTETGYAEVHKNVTDIWYVTEGGGVLVTGGTLTDPTESAPGEIRAPSLSGGYERKIAKGDFLRIPAGVPHWVHKIDGKEIVYLNVKVPQS